MNALESIAVGAAAVVVWGAGFLCGWAFRNDTLRRAEDAAELARQSQGGGGITGGV